MTLFLLLQAHLKHHTDFIISAYGSPKCSIDSRAAESSLAKVGLPWFIMWTQEKIGEDCYCFPS